MEKYYDNYLYYRADAAIIRQRTDHYISAGRAGRIKRYKKSMLFTLELAIALLLTALAAYIYSSAGNINETLAASRTSSPADSSETRQNSVKLTGLSGEAMQTQASDNPYTSYSYYIEGNLGRYEVYRKKRPELALSDVVWHVNADLDKGFYTDVVEIDSPAPLLVNKSNKLPDDYVPELSEIYYGLKVTPDTMEAFKRMRRAAMSQGYIIDAVSGYRSFERQRALYEDEVNKCGEKYTDMYLAKAGYSEHQTGRAIDIAGSFGSINDFEQTPEYEWVVRNCEEYGFIIRYTSEAQHITGYMSEPWHIMFVGREISTDMKKLGIKSLEEYVAKNTHYLEPIQQ